MSTEQPEALRLAAALDDLLGYRGINPDVGKAASELRRLHQINQSHEMRLSVRGYEIQIDSLEMVNKELLEVLQLCEGNIDSLLASAHPKVFGIWLDVVRAAIAKATGDKA